MIHRLRSGQTLVVLLVFIAMGLAVVAASVSTVINSSVGTTQYERGQSAYLLAESGAEEGILRLLRDPSFSAGALTSVDGNATITVTGTSTKTILSTATVGTTVRTIQVVASFVNDVLTVTSWKEI